MRPLPAVFLGLGSNLGDREGALEEALRLLEARGFHATARSALYETEPVGGPAQGWYLNAVVKGVTDLSPEELLAAGHEVEHSLGRVRGEPNGPRTLDVDLLLYGDEIRSGGALTLPHPRLHERLFVLVPLCEIDPSVLHPGLGMTARALLEACPDRSRVRARAPHGIRA